MPMAGGSGVPGEILYDDDPVEVNPGRPVLTVVVRNTGDRPVQVGSHYHFAAANPALDFDRAAAWGMRLAVPAGTAARFEPGVEREVDLVPIGGARVVPGLRPEHAGPLDGRDVPGLPSGTNGTSTSTSTIATIATSTTSEQDEPDLRGMPGEQGRHGPDPGPDPGGQGGRGGQDGGDDS